MARITATINVRVGTTEQWTSAQKALATGELGYDTEKHELRIGDGASLWSALPLVNDKTIEFDEKYVSDVVEGTENGKIKVTKNDSETEVAVHGLGTAAYKTEEDFATAEQGTKADTAVQSVTVAGVAATGDAGVVSVDKDALIEALEVYTKTETDNKIDEKITEALTDVVKNVSVAGVDATVEGNKAIITEDDLRTALTDGADQEKALATQAFVNSSITANAARFITPTAKGDSQWANFEALETGPDYYYEGQKLTSDQLTNNDYAIFKKSVEGGAGEQWRALYQKSGEGPGTWVEQYRIGSAFTDAQQQAINSGITKAKVATYDGYDAKITAVKTTADAAMPKSGGTFTGTVTLNADPTEDLEAATKKYVDDAKAAVTSSVAGTYAPKENPTFTGAVTVPETPKNDTDAASKKYVDDTVAGVDVSGQITAEIDKLNNTDAEVAGQYVSAVKESKGIVTVERKTLPTAPTITGTSPIKVDNAEGTVTISHEGSTASGSVDAKATTFVSEVTTNETGHVTAYKTNTLEQALAALGTIEIDGGTAEDYLAGE